jgi:hypothetical protein
MAEFNPSAEDIVLAHFIVSDDVERSRRFYTEVLGGTVAFSGEARPMTSRRSPWRPPATPIG